MSTERFSKFCFAMAIVVSLVGCAGVQRQAFNKEANRELRTIGLLKPPFGWYIVDNPGHPGGLFGPVGMLIGASDAISKTNKFNEIIKARNFSLADDFAGLLTAELQRVGYSVKVISPPMIRTAKSGFLENYDTLDRDVDAYLDLYLFAGYMCAWSLSDYIPHVRIRVRLVRRGSNEILYQDFFSYGQEFRAAVNIAASERYFFKDFAALTTNPDLAIEGLRTGVQVVVARIVQELSKR